ncbi:MAG: hypothetical protein SFU86_23305 [Pirellulaceae bacterium]|nr:hypothetical protein [Pirellulaceae bacterium]
MNKGILLFILTRRVSRGKFSPNVSRFRCGLVCIVEPRLDELAFGPADG